MTEAEEAARHWQGRALRPVAERENAVHAMDTPLGPAALRLHRRGYQDAAAILAELDWTAALAAAGLPVPQPLPAAGGGRLVTLSTGRHATAVGWLPGRPLGEAGRPFDAPPQEVQARYRALGSLLARVHAAAPGVPADWARPVWDAAGLAGETPVWGRFWEHPAAGPDDRRALVRARDALRERLADPALGPLRPIHADVLRENVLVDGDRLALIDFGDCGRGFALYDLGTAMLPNLGEPAPGAIRDALLEGYGSGSPETVDLLTLARCCASVGWTMPRLPPGHPVHRSHIARAVMWAGRVPG